MYRRLMLMITGAVALWACAPDTSGITALTGDAANGASLYEANCKVCHGATGAGRGDPAAAVDRDLAKAAAVVLSGDDEMPAFADTLSDQEIADVLAWLKTQ